ncbi:MAG: LacI family DNA-binding transcriptional regulator [Clostridium sp.]
MEQHKYNIIDIARLAQVSTATVSRVLHEKGGYSKETETRVRRVIAECGFQLNKNAQGLRTQKAGISVLSCRISPMNFCENHPLPGTVLSQTSVFCFDM